MTENWKPVVGFEGEYEVSDLGRVRSLDRVKVYQRVDQYSGKTITVTRHHKGQMLRPGPKKSGHLSVALGREGGSKDVHVLVLEAFDGPCPPGFEALHGDGQPDHNHINNLRWGTRGENVNDAIRHGAMPIGDRKWNAKLNDADIPIIRSKFYRQSFVSIAYEYGVSEATIRQIKDGRTWKHIQEIVA